MHFRLLDAGAILIPLADKRDVFLRLRRGLIRQLCMKSRPKSNSVQRQASVLRLCFVDLPVNSSLLRDKSDASGTHRLYGLTIDEH